MTLAPEITDLLRRANGFLRDPEQIVTGQSDTLLLRARFTLERFSPELFDALGILCPASLSAAVDKRRAEFLAGRAMVKMAFQTLGLPDADIPIGPDRAPVWPLGVAGSISHARGHCAAILCANPERFTRHFGVDIEAYASPRAQAAIAKIALTESDRALLAASGPQAPLASDRLATLIFSAKETLFKALYPQVRAYFGFDAAALTASPAHDHLTLRLTRPLHAKLPEGAEFTLRYALREDHLVTWLITQP